MTFADLNGDGIPDLIATDIGGGTLPGSVVVWLGASDGTFHSQASYAVHQGPISVAAGDFNKDGKLDLAVANSRSGDVSILIGKGDGTFATARNYLATGNPTSVAAADFNGDGKLDLAVADQLGSMVVSLGNGDGTFQNPQRSFAGGGNATPYVAAGDFNGDGKMDAAILSAGAGTVSVLVGNGDGSFAPAVSYAVPAGGSSLIVTDINDDGKLDILVAAGTPFLITDYRQSGYETLLLGNGDGTFQAGALQPTGAQPGSLVVADFNGDGKLDVMTANQGTGDLSLLLGLGGGLFASATSVKLGEAASALAVTDLNGDRRADAIAVEPASDDVAILYSVGSGQFQNAVHYAAGNDPRALALADFNSDRFTDIAVADYGGGVTILMGEGSGGFQGERPVTAGSHPIALAAADLNKDGHPDLVVVNNGTSGADTGGVSVLLGNGDMTFQKAMNFAAGLNPRTLALGDFNGDGNLDAAVGTTSASGAPQLAILLGKGDGTFGAPAFVATASLANNIEAVRFQRRRQDGSGDFERGPFLLCRERGRDVSSGSSFSGRARAGGIGGGRFQRRRKAGSGHRRFGRGNGSQRSGDGVVERVSRRGGDGERGELHGGCAGGGGIDRVRLRKGPRDGEGAAASATGNERGGDDGERDGRGGCVTRGECLFRFAGPGELRDSRGYGGGSGDGGGDLR